MAEGDSVSLTAGAPNGGTPPSDFSSMIPEEFRGHPSLAPIKDLGGLVKSYVSAQEMIGKDKVVLPNEKSTPEQWNEFFGRLGRPESPDKYGLTKDGLPEGLTVDDDYLKSLSGAFHEAGLSAAQAKKVFDAMNAYAAKNFTDSTTQEQMQMTQAMENLRKEFGSAFDARIDGARRAVATFLDEQSREFLQNSGLDGHPEMVRIFAEIGAKLGEPATDGGGGQGGGGFGPMTPAQANAEINARYADAEFMQMYNDRYHPRHAWAVEQLQQLFHFAHPPQQRSE